MIWEVCDSSPRCKEPKHHNQAEAGSQNIADSRFQTTTSHQNTESCVNMAAVNYQDNSSATSKPTTSKNDSPILWALGIKQYNWINNIVIPKKRWLESQAVRQHSASEHSMTERTEQTRSTHSISLDSHTTPEHNTLPPQQWIDMPQTIYKRVNTRHH